MRPPRRHDLFTTTEAARLLHRDRRVLDRWQRYGWLRPSSRDHRGRPLFTLPDIKDALIASQKTEDGPQ